MRLLHHHHHSLEDALRAAYHDKARDELEISSRWKTNLMRDVRRLGPLNETEISWACLNRYVWRFATAACVIVLMLSVYAGVSGFDTTAELANLFLEDPVEFTLVQAIGE